MTQHTLFVCVLCRSGHAELAYDQVCPGQELFDRLQAELEADAETVRVQPVRCMGACDRSCVAAFAAPEKLTFILKDLSPIESVPELVQFGRQYAAASDGKVPYRERPAAVRQGIHAVLPPLPLLPPVAAEA